MGILKSFKNIFSKPKEKNKRENIEKKVCELFLKIFSNKSISEENVIISTIDVDEFENEINAYETIYSKELYKNSDEALLYLLHSEKLQNDFKALFKQHENEKNAFYSFLSETIISTFCKNEKAFSLFEEYRKNNYKALWWRLSYFKILKVNVKDKTAFIALNPYIEKEENVDDEDDTIFHIQNKNEYKVVDLLIPHKTEFEGNVFVANPYSLKELKGYENTRDGNFKVKATLALDKERYNISYIFKNASLNALKNSLSDNISRLFTEFLKKTVLEIKKQSKKAVGIVELAAKKEILYPENERLISLSVNAAINGKQLETEVIFPYAFLLSLAKDIFRDDEYYPYKEDIFREKSILTKLSVKLFLKHFKTFIEDVRGNRYVGIGLKGLESTEAMLFYEFLNLLSKSDLNRVLQSYIALDNTLVSVRDYSRVGVMMTDNRLASLKVADFDEDRFLSLIPPKWQNAYLNERFSPSFTKDSFVFENIKIMKKLYDEYRKDRLILSKRGKYIFEENFISVYNEEKRKELLKMIDQNVVLNKYKELSYEQKMKSISYLIAKPFFIEALYKEEKFFEELRTFVSKNAFTMLKEDYAFILRKVENKILLSSDIIEAKNTLCLEFEEILKRVV